MIFAPEPTTTAIGGGLKAIAAGGKGLFNLVRNPKQTIDKGLSSLGRLKSRITEGKRFNNPVSSPQSTSNLPVPASKFKDMGLEVVKDVAPRAVGAGIIIPQLLPDGVEKEIDNEDTTKSTEQLEIDRLNALLAEMRNKDSETVDTSKDKRNADMLIGLGGAIGSAKNLGELSSNISDAYFGVQSKRDAKDLAGLQGRLIEAQASKYEADVANMGPKDIINEQNSISAFLKQANEGAIQLTEQQKNELAQRYFDLQKQLDTLRSQTGTGFAVSESPTGGDMDIFKKTKIPA